MCGGRRQRHSHCCTSYSDPSRDLISAVGHASMSQTMGPARAHFPDHPCIDGIIHTAAAHPLGHRSIIWSARALPPPTLSAMPYSRIQMWRRLRGCLGVARVRMCARHLTLAANALVWRRPLCWHRRCVGQAVPALVCADPDPAFVLATVEPGCSRHVGLMQSGWLVLADFNGARYGSLGRPSLAAGCWCCVGRAGAGAATGPRCWCMQAPCGCLSCAVCCYRTAACGAAVAFKRPLHSLSARG
jgi:hypothetical protein